MTKSTSTHDDIDLDAIDAQLAKLDPADTTRVHDGRDLREIARITDAIAVAQTELVDAVATARRNGKSWGLIAISLGVTRQSARERFKDRVDGQITVGPGAGTVRVGN